MKRTRLIFGIVALCLAAGIIGSARAEEIKCTRENFTFSLEVKFMPRQQAFDYCKSLGLWPDVQVMPKYGRKGCNLYYQDKNHLVIVTPPPREVDDDATLNLGHELHHGICGNYHK